MVNSRHHANATLSFMQHSCFTAVKWHFSLSHHKMSLEFKILNDSFDSELDNT